MGNPEDQLLSVQDSWLDVPLAVDVSDGVMLKSICGYKRLRLTEGKRSCRELFDFYSSCAHSGHRFKVPQADMTSETQRLFPDEAERRLRLLFG